MSDDDLIRRGDALYAIAGWEIPSTAIAALPAVTVGVPLKQIGTGLYEQPAPGHVNEKPKTEHDAGNVLTPAPDAAAIREAVAKVRTKLADQDDAALLLGAEWALTMIEALTEKP